MNKMNSTPLVEQNKLVFVAGKFISLVSCLEVRSVPTSVEHLTAQQMLDWLRTNTPSYFAVPPLTKEKRLISMSRRVKNIYKCTLYH